MMLRSKGSIVLIACAVNFYLSEVSLATSPSVRIQDGLLSGTTIASKNGRPIYAFYGIPFAAPPVLERRFKEPEPVKPWMGTWNASISARGCYQFSHSFYSTFGSEDCLYLTVYTTKLPSADYNPNLDVIVFFHGGAFMFGSPDIYQPQYLLDSDDVVFVLSAYRLGPLGFLSTGDDVVPGNNGLKDQVMALQWVQKNIAAFGGNPKSVTIIGNSAGGASVHYHYLSQLSKGLFHRGYSQSGTPLNPWAYTENVPEKSRSLARNLGCPTENSFEMIKCLQGRNAEAIVRYSHSHLMAWKYNPFSPWGPTVEVNSSKPFIDEHPYTLLERGQVQDLPWLISFTTDEGLYPVGEYAENYQNALNELDLKWNDVASSLLDFKDTIPEISQLPLSQEIRQFYFENEPISTETYTNLIKVVGDRLYLTGIQTAARLQAAANKSPVYLLHFAAPIKRGLPNIFTNCTKYLGVSHADDLSYTLKAPWGAPESSEADWALSRILVNLWISLSTKNAPNVGGIEFPAISRNAKRVGDLEFIEIRAHDDIRVIKKSELNNYHFWLSIGSTNY